MRLFCLLIWSIPLYCVGFALDPVAFTSSKRSGCKSYDAWGFSLPEKPKSRINDYAQVLSPTVLLKLEEKFAKFEVSSGHQAVVAIFPTIENESIKELATKLFKKWGLGSKKENPGVLLVIDLKGGVLHVEGGERKIPDTLAIKIIQEDLLPFLKQNQIATTLLVFENKLEQLFLGNSKSMQPHLTKRRVPLSAFVLFLLFLIFFLKFIRTHTGREISSRGAYYCRGWRGTGNWRWRSGGKISSSGDFREGGGASGHW